MNRNFEQAQGIQRRTVAAELRASEGGPDFLIEGYAATFNKVSQDLGGFREVIKPGAFARTIAAGTDIVCLANHSPLTGILGRCSAGTLKVSEDSKGLRYSCQLDKNQQAHRDLWSSIKRGDLRYCSFAFTVTPEGQDWHEGPEENGQPMYVRTLTDVGLIDVSPVCYPAYEGTAVNARAKGGIGAKAARISAEVIEIFRKVTRSMTPKFFVRDESRTEGDEGALVRSHLEQCHQMLESAYASSDTARSMMDCWDWDDDDDQDDLRFHKTAERRAKKGSPYAPYGDPSDLRCFRELHAKAHAAMEECCKQMARCRLSQPVKK